MIFISAPFGNYLKFENAISVAGTFTVKPRKGRLKQIFKTLRYVKTEAGWSWRNKLGLRNPGLIAGMRNTSFRKILSVAAIDETDWTSIFKSISKERNIELNVSCPNLDSHNDTTTWQDFDKFAKGMNNEYTIVKIPPNATEEFIDNIVDMGYKQIHASNTLPTEQGGLSGKILMPHTLGIIRYLRNKHPHVEIIAGGGVTTSRDAKIYKDAGANHISLGSVCFTPWKIKKIINEETK
tara:strand:- start:6644 stop:7357 length:714 start_codon:yes stop_codon:yes gene_type:complete